MEPGGSQLRSSAVVAAEQYRRASAMAERARGELVSALQTEGPAVNRQEIRRIAGVSSSTLYRWLEEG